MKRAWLGFSAITASVVLGGTAFGQEGEYDDRHAVDRKTRNAVNVAAEAIGDGQEAVLLDAETEIDGALAGRGRNAYEAALLLASRAQLRTLRGDQAGAVADIRSVLDGRALMPFEAGRMYGLLQRLLIEAADPAGIVAAHEKYGEDLSPLPTDLMPMIAEAFASVGDPAGGLAVLTQRLEGSVDIGSPLEAYRYVMLLQMRRFGEAEAALATFGTNPMDPTEVVLVGEKQLALFAREAPTRVAVQQAAFDFLAALNAWQQRTVDAEPAVRVNPSGFERCLRGKPRGHTDKVVVEFDVEVDGSISNVKAIDSTDRCYDRFAIRAVEQWKFEPATRDGMPTRSPRMRSYLKFQVG